ncbi:MAG: acetate--CoA ligase family protein [Chloroflexi bacterium]|nr:acetate--CoA ligase family protein [Chloroflexota bacterium]
MRLLEHEAKTLLRKCGFAVPASRLAATAEDAAMSAGTLGYPVVLKAQVPSGGRMKAGAIRFASSPEEAHQAAQEVLSREVNGHLPQALLVERQAQVSKECYLGATYDTSAKLPLALFSPLGGVDIEEVAEAHPEKVARVRFSALLPATDYPFKQGLAAAGVAGRELTTLTPLLSRLARALLDYDLTLAEVNPLALLPDGAAMALDAHIEIEDEALYRQGALVKELGVDPADRLGPRATAFEKRAAEIDASDHRGVAGRMVEFDGSLGLIIGGGGGSLTIFDAVRKHGGRPANYCEIGGNPSVRKVCALTRLLLSKPGVHKIAVMMSVVNNTRADLVARGVIKGVVEAGFDPAQKVAVFRIPGSWEEESFKLLGHYGVPFLDRHASLDEAAHQAVSRT